MYSTVYTCINYCILLFAGYMGIYQVLDVD